MFSHTQISCDGRPALWALTPFNCCSAGSEHTEQARQDHLKELQLCRCSDPVIYTHPKTSRELCSSHMKPVCRFTLWPLGADSSSESVTDLETQRSLAIAWFTFHSLTISIFCACLCLCLLYSAECEPKAGLIFGFYNTELIFLPTFEV